MLGGMLAGHDQSGGEVITGEDGKKRKLFYGMSSATAMKKHKGGVAEYRASEGKTVEVGSLRNSTTSLKVQPRLSLLLAQHTTAVAKVS